jgi:hypothetical protein
MREIFYEMHRSEAVLVLLGKDKVASTYTNLKLAAQLESHFPEKGRLYLVKEDHLPLGEICLTSKSF